MTPLAFSRATLRGSGWLAVFCLGVCGATGIPLALYYVPSADGAYRSLVDLHERLPTVDCLRSLHCFAAHLALGLALAHLGAVLVHRLIRDGVAANAPAADDDGRPTLTSFQLSGGGLLLAVVLLAYTGRILPWDRHGQLASQVALWFLGGPRLLEQLPLDDPAFIPRVWALHVGLTVLVWVSLGSHAPLRSGIAAWAMQPRRIQRWYGGLCLTVFVGLLTIAIAATVPLGSSPAPAGEGASMLPALADESTNAEWYVRWIDFLVRKDLAFARVMTVGLCAGWLASSWLRGRRDVRWLSLGWLGVLACLGVLSVLPR